MKLASELIARGFEVCVAKHDPGDKAEFDVAGKDSARYFGCGAQVGVISPRRVSLFFNRGLFGGNERIQSQDHAQKSEKFAPEGLNSTPDLERDLRELVRHFGEFDYLIIEGLKYLPVPKIAVFRGEFDPQYLGFASAVISDLDMDFGVEKFGLNDVKNVIEWIDKNAKRM